MRINSKVETYLFVSLVSYIVTTFYIYGPSLTVWKVINEGGSTDHIHKSYHKLTKKIVQ